MNEMKVNREEWLTNACAGFVTTKPANRNYYRLILETLWPPEHHIPGPIVSLSLIRQVIDDFRATGEPYQDVPRRIRELQGEEGFLGIIRLGSGKKTRYQLVSLEIGIQREQRVKLSDTFWKKILNKYKYHCAVCTRQTPTVSLEQDHKIPRLRGGGNNVENWQPLCRECNNFKSTACRGCDLDCNYCSWAFPEKFTPIKISADNIQKLKLLAIQEGVTPEVILAKILDRYFTKNSL